MPNTLTPDEEKNNIFEPLEEAEPEEETDGEENIEQPGDIEEEIKK